MRLPALTIIFLFIFSILIDFYIALDIRQIWKKKGMAGYIVSAVCCYALLIVAISLPRRDADSDISAVMWLLFTFLTIYAGKFFYLLFSLFGRLSRSILQLRGGNSSFRWIGLLAGIAIMAIMWIGAGYTRRQINVIQEDFYSQNLPESFDGYRIVQVSDMHVGTWGKDTSFIKNLVDTVNSLSPDLIVFTGDIVNRKTDEILPFIEVLGGMKSKDGVYSILGNHDYGDYVDWPTPQQKEENLELLKAIQKGMGWKLLTNESEYLSNGRDSILVVGVENWGEPPFHQYGDLSRALSGFNDSIGKASYKLLLSHNPEHWNQEVSKNYDIDLTLSGHTHAMQAILKVGKWKWSPSKFKYEQWGGEYKKENEKGYPVSLYVNIGAGEVGMPARLLSAYPEVTLITLKRGEKPDL